MIVVMAPPGVDVNKHTDYIAKKYSLCNIDPEQLVKEFGETDAECKQLLKNQADIPDEVNVRLLKKKLDLGDCKKKGWVMIGSPNVLDHINILEVKPSLILTLDLSDHLIYDKLEQRRFDPVTKKYHYLFQENLKDEIILNRLEHKYEDQHTYLKKKVQEYRDFISHFAEEYPNKKELIRISTE